MDPNNRSITPSNAGNITAAASSTSHHHHHHQRPLAPLLPATLLDQQQQQQQHHQQQQQQRIVNNLPQEWRSVPNYHHADPEGGPAFLPMPQVATLPPNTTGASGAAITTTTSINNPSASSSAAQKPIIAGVYPPHHTVNGATTPTTHEFYPYNSRYHPSNPTHARGHSPPPPASSLNIGGSPNRKQGMYEERLGDNGEMIRVQPFQPSQGAGNGAAPVYHGHVEDPTWEHQQFTKAPNNGGVVGVARDEVEEGPYPLLTALRFVQASTTHLITTVVPHLTHNLNINLTRLPTTTPTLRTTLIAHIHHRQKIIPPMRMDTLRHIAMDILAQMEGTTLVSRLIPRFLMNIKEGLWRGSGCRHPSLFMMGRERERGGYRSRRVNRQGGLSKA
ncbi:hypothetical protein BC829DRAFT_393747 [Chytridium lagenaria]|nr:hypothetical protein BC829DRAFT_393747 [Chytridium lagenaria]